MPMTTMIARALAALMLMLLPSALFAADDWPLPRGEPTSLGLSPDGLRRIADTLNGLMAVPNLIGVLASIPLLLRLQREFFARTR